MSADTVRRDAAEEARSGSVGVEILGQALRLGCEPGQEERLIRLAAEVDRRARALGASGVTPANTPFARLMLMTALMLADELTEAEAQAERRIERLTAELDDTRRRADAATEAAAEAAAAAASAPTAVAEPAERAPADALDHAFARILIDAARRLESAAERLETA